jgi:hypothetical protein
MFLVLTNAGVEFNHLDGNLLWQLWMTLPEDADEVIRRQRLHEYLPVKNTAI